METFEQNPFETNRAEGGLRTLLIFTIVFQALGLLFGLLGLLQVSTQTGFTQASTIITPLLNLEMLIAAILMLKLKKIGWTLYLGAKGLMLIFMVLMLVFAADEQIRQVQMQLVQTSPAMAKSAPMIFYISTGFVALGKLLFPALLAQHRHLFNR
jgi:hypothetical protein